MKLTADLRLASLQNESTGVQLEVYMKLAVMVALAVGAPLAHAAEFEATEGWKEIAPDVYERRNVDGTIERGMVGERGAEYAYERIREKIAELEWSKAYWSSDSSEVDAVIRDMKALIERDEKLISPPMIRASQTGTMCGGLRTYSFTNTLTTSSTNASLYGKSKVQVYDGFSPPWFPTDGLASVQLTIYRSGMAPVSAVAGWNMNNPAATWEGNDLFVSWTINSSSATPQVRPYSFCTSAEVFHQVYLKGAMCGTYDQRIWTKTYPGCYP